MDYREIKILKASLIEVQEALIEAYLNGDRDLADILIRLQTEKVERLKNGITGGNSKGTTAPN